MRKKTKKNTVVSRSEAETMEIAARFANQLRGGEVVLLEGDLGAGKTTFVRGLARAFGIREPVRSPTFTLMHVHRVRSRGSGIKQLVHVDAYRLRGAADLRAIGLEEYLGKKDTAVVIEWGKRVQSITRLLPTIRIQFNHSKNSNQRTIIGIPL